MTDQPDPGDRDRWARLRLAARCEVRSFAAEHGNALCHLELYVSSRDVLTARGTWAKPLALCIVDARSRLAAHVQCHLDHTGHSVAHGLAVMRPRAVLTDNGGSRKRSSRGRTPR